MIQARLIAGIVLLVSLVAGGWGLYAWGREGHKSAREAAELAAARATQLDAAAEALKAFKRNAENDREVLSELLRRQTQRLKESEKARKGLENALKNNRDWADQPIPSGVLDALSGGSVPAGKPPGALGATAGLPGP